MAAALADLANLIGAFASWRDFLDAANLQKLVEKTKNVLREESALPASKIAQKNDPNAAKLAEFQAWLEKGMENATQTPLFRVENMGARGNGLVAQVEIPADAELLTIPVNLLILSEFQQPFEQLRQDPLCAQFPSVSLALNLLYEALKEDSFYAPYIAVLPRNFHLPYYYSVEDFEALQATPATHSSAIQLMYNSLRQYLYLQNALRQTNAISLDQFTLSNYLWALGVVLTRQNNVPTTSNPASLALIPGWDMCNHAPGPMTTYATDDAIVCEAMQTFAKGDEITICYGPRSNAHFLIYSGFSIPSNENDHVQLTLPLPSDDPLAKIRKLLLEKRQATLSTDHSIDVVIASDGCFSDPRFRQQVQLLALDKAELTAALRQDEASVAAFDLVPWSSDAKQKANAIFHNACTLRVEQLTAALKSTCHTSITEYLTHERAIYERALQSTPFDEE